VLGIVEEAVEAVEAVAGVEEAVAGVEEAVVEAAAGVRGWLWRGMLQKVEKIRKQRRGHVGAVFNKNEHVIRIAPKYLIINQLLRLLHRNLYLKVPILSLLRYVLLIHINLYQLELEVEAEVEVEVEEEECHRLGMVCLHIVAVGDMDEGKMTMNMIEETVNAVCQMYFYGQIVAILHQMHLVYQL
jgi:hypothetical protein